MQLVKKFFIMAMVAISVPGIVFAQTIATTTFSSNPNPNATVASTVQSYFADIPVMIAIAKCESGPRQFAGDGSPLYAGTGGEMVGVFQIDSNIHTAPALALGFDITTLVGNLGYARYLYGAEGTEPWISSFPCWGAETVSGTVSTGAAGATPATVAVASTTASASPALTENLSLGSIDPQVLVLQQLLNKAGFTLATSGPGSPGNETTKFGALTYVALKKFQCAQGIACSGDEATTGYGLLNAPTRAALLAAAAPSASVATAPSAPTSDPAEVAELQSRVAALVVIVGQLEAELAARLGH